MANTGRVIAGLIMTGLGGLIGYSAYKDEAVFGPDGILTRSIQRGGVSPGASTGHLATGTTQKKGTTTAGGRGG